MLRVLRLADASLWGDEMMTALYALGLGPASLEPQGLIDRARLEALLQWHPATLGSITDAMIGTSTHPPLFFWFMHAWLGVTFGGDGWQLEWLLRLPSALAGTLLILMGYHLARRAWPDDGAWPALATAAIVAVSPMAVYVSREARAYSAAGLLMTAGLIALVTVLRRAADGETIGWGAPLAWVASAALGFYTHYLCVVAFAAQGAAAAWLGWRVARGSRRRILTMCAVSAAAVVLLSAPWTGVLIRHAGLPSAQWAGQSGGWLARALTPLAAAGSALTVFAAAPFRSGATTAGLIMAAGSVAVLAWALHPCARRLKPKNPDLATAVFKTVSLLSVIGLVSASLALDMRLSEIPRYFFVLLPALPAAVAGCLRRVDVERRRRSLGALVAVGIAGSLIVVAGQAIETPLQPDETAARLRAADAGTNLVIWPSGSGVGLSLARPLVRADGEGGVIFNRGREASRATIDIVRAARHPVNVWIEGAIDPSPLDAAGCRTTGVRLRISGKGLVHVTCP